MDRFNHIMNFISAAIVTSNSRDIIQILKLNFISKNKSPNNEVLVVEPLQYFMYIARLS